MQKISKTEPDYFKNAKLKVILPKVSDAWRDKNITNIRPKLRKDILHEEQNSLCAYCEKKIDAEQTKSNIDHFKKRNLFPEFTLNYYNLLVSCNSKFHCSNKKDNSSISKTSYDKIINPVIEDPNDFLDYTFTGDVISKTSLNTTHKKKADFTISIFALNNKSLQQDRKKITSTIQRYKKDHGYQLPELIKVINSYASFIKFIYQNT